MELIMKKKIAIISFILFLTVIHLQHQSEAAAAARDDDVHHKNKNKIGVYELKRGDFSVKITNYGATLLSLILPDKNGKLDDIVLGYPYLDEYKNDTTYFGAIVGRVANRIGGAKFTLNGVQYKLPANDHGNTLHGGPKGYGFVVWHVKSYKKDRHLSLTYNSYDGEEGFPGNVSVTVTYILIGKHELGIKMQAKALNKATPINLASHTYFNLAGHGSGDVFSHKIQLFGSKITPVDHNLIPTGEIKPVQGTAYDFLEPRTIGSRFKEIPGGYDVNYVVDPPNGNHFRKVAIVVEEDNKSGRKLELWSNQPGVQFYTGNMLKTTKGKEGAVYHQYGGFCLETQGFPDSVNHPNFPTQTVNPGQTYLHAMLYRFTAD